MASSCTASDFQLFANVYGTFAGATLKNKVTHATVTELPLRLFELYRFSSKLYNSSKFRATQPSFREKKTHIKQGFFFFILEVLSSGLLAKHIEGVNNKTLVIRKTASDAPLLTF